jgi:cob(I)alamin adenosyltransferase
MVKLNKIYTKTGDSGETGLVDGSRVPKFDLHIHVCGDVDEANSVLGLVRQHTDTNPLHDAMLERIQHDLFDLGADIATPFPATTNNNDPFAQLRIIASQVERLEQEIDAMNDKIPPLNSFILPGGSPASCYLHVARNTVRRAERQACQLAAETKVNPLALHYLNRLSDHLFVMARALNDNGTTDITWKPGCNR